MISSAAADLRRYPASAAAYLQDGLPPNAPWGIKSSVRMPQDRLKATMAHLASARPARFLRRRSGAEPRRRYSGRRRRAVGRRPRAVPRPSARAAGDPLSRRQGVCDAGTHRRTDAVAHARPAAGQNLKPARGGPDAAAYIAYASALQAAYRERLKDMGDADGRRALGAEALAPACTTHFSAVDRDGNMAAVTQTLLSTFGSKFVSPPDRHHHEQRHHVVRPDAGHAEFAGARQALPHQLHAGAGAGSRRPARSRSAPPADGASCRR